MKKSLCLLIVSLLPVLAGAQQAKLHFSREELSADLDTLYASIGEIHPDMFAYYPKADFERNLAEAKASLKDSMDRFDFYNIASELVAKLGDGHTGIYPPSTTPEKLLLPLDVKIDKKTYSVTVVADLSGKEAGIPVGAEIRSINGRIASDAVKELLKHQSGEKESFRIEMVKEDFPRRLYCLYKEPEYDVEYSCNGDVFHRKMPGIPYRTLQKNKPALADRKRYSLSIDDNNIAVIQFNEFLNLDEFKTFIDSTVTLLKERKINDLIIDVRQNGGGDSKIGDEFFRYISSGPFSQFGKVIAKISDRQKRRYEKAYKDLRYSSMENGIVIWPESKKDLMKPYKNRNRYCGDIYLLTSNYTFSSAADFSWVFKFFKMGTIIGEETGGLAVCFGDVIPAILPNTKISCWTSCKKFYSYGATDNDVHGTIPDFEVPAEEAMDFAIELIKKPVWQKAK